MPCDAPDPSQSQHGHRQMPEALHPTADQQPATTYEIRLAGHLDPAWGDWFSGLTVTSEENGDTLLTGPVVDQAALHGLLRKVRDLGVPLVSVIRAEPVGTRSSTDSEED